MTGVDREDLMRYLDGELPRDELDRLEAMLAGSTELQRELAIFRAMKHDMQDLSFSVPRTSGIWAHVSRRVARPLGWTLLLAGATVWAAYGAYTYVVSPADLMEKAATGAVVIGVILLLISVIWEQYKAWESEPYRDVQR